MSAAHRACLLSLTHWVSPPLPVLPRDDRDDAAEST